MSNSNKVIPFRKPGSTITLPLPSDASVQDELAYYEALESQKIASELQKRDRELGRIAAGSNRDQDPA